MSMNATFVQVEETELSRIQADPSLAETLFQDGPIMPPVFGALAKTIQDRARAVGPQVMADALSRLDPKIRQQLEERLGRTTSAFATGQGGDTILKMMEERRLRLAALVSSATFAEGGPSAGTSSARTHTSLSLDKAWPGVHYLLSGQPEPGTTLVSQAVLGGTKIGDDDEGFSGYGPARFFTVAEVAKIARTLSHPEVESEAARRFDVVQMSELKIYPGWRASEAESELEWVMDAFRRLRDFYSEAATKGRAIVTCLV
jgi:hypothetical protein